MKVYLERIKKATERITARDSKARAIKTMEEALAGEHELAYSKSVIGVQFRTHPSYGWGYNEIHIRELDDESVSSIIKILENHRAKIEKQLEEEIQTLRISACSPTVDPPATAEEE